MIRTTRFLLVILAALLLLLVGCAKQETTPSPSPSPTPTPAPPPHAGGNPQCVGDGAQGDTCKLTTADVASETGPQHDCGGQFDDATAIHLKKTWQAGAGKFKKIRIVKGGGHSDDFEITIEACPGSPANPFPSASNPHKNDWQSGDLAPGVPVGSKYRLKMKEIKKKGAKESDPHIIIDQGP